MKDKEPKTQIPDFTGFKEAAVKRTISSLLKAFPSLGTAFQELTTQIPQLKEKFKPVLNHFPELDEKPNK